jgi:succinate dehydrogenase / fumarate reductase flavoprotein subunit
MASGSILDSKIPSGKMSEKWEEYKGHVALVAPNNKRKIDVIVVGTGLAGASAAASLGELGYNVKAFTFPRQPAPCALHRSTRAASTPPKTIATTATRFIALFYDTIKGGDFRAREANVHRLAEVSTGIIDQCVAQGVPFAGNTAACSTTAHSAAPR